jgi:peptidoglycan hydrolase-like protein with peptidoglycan-binding domain
MRDDDILIYTALAVGGFFLLKNFTKSGGMSAVNAATIANLVPTSPAVGSNSYGAWVQQTLNKLYPNANLAVDGVIGPQTRRYVIMFQETWGITPDGIVGPETDYALRGALGLPGYIEQPYQGTATASPDQWY